MNKELYEALKKIVALVNCYELKKKKIIQARSCRFEYDNEGCLIKYIGKAHDYSVYVKGLKK